MFSFALLLKCSLLVLADYRIDFKVSEAFLPVDFGWAQLYTFSIGDPSPAFILTASRTLLFALVAQVLVQVTSVEFLLLDILVYAFCARRRLSESSKTAACLLRTEILSQHAADFIPGLLAVSVIFMAFMLPRHR